MYTFNFPCNTNTTTATYADDTTLLSRNENPVGASPILQKEMDAVQQWLTEWRIKVISTKSHLMIFKMRERTCSNITINNIILQKYEVK